VAKRSEGRKEPAATNLPRSLAQHILSRLGEAGQPPEVGIAHINVGNETYLRVLEEEYLRPIAEEGRGSSFKLVQAYYGGGKTHFLHCVRERAWSLGFPAGIVGLSPDECPFDDPVRIYTAVAREVAWPPRDPLVPPARGVDELLRSALEEKTAASPPEAVRGWVLQQVRRVPADSHSYRMAVARFLLAILDGETDAEDILAAYLRGEAVAASDLKDFGVREEIQRHTAFRFLRSLIQVLQAIGAPGLLLGFDELDRNLSFGASRRRAIADNLRQLIDLCGREALPGLLCLYAVPPEFLTRIVPEYVALQQRLEAPSALSARSPQAVVIDLENLDLPQEDLLAGIGERILRVFQVAHGASLDGKVQSANLRLLAKTVLERTWDVAHRRSFVKAAVALLADQERSGGRKLPKEHLEAFLTRPAGTAPPGMGAGEDGAAAVDDFEDI
jgi:hypothetical protein